MKTSINTRWLVTFGMVIALGSNVAFARGVNRKVSAENTEVANLTNTSDQLSFSGQSFALGYTVGGPMTATVYSLTAMYKLSEKDLLQPFFVIPGTNPFQISSAMAYKRTLASGQNSSFHVGAGLGVGSIASNRATGGNSFYFSASAIAGLAFRFSGTPNIQIHVDGGPCFQTGDGTSNFTVDLLSASVVYWF